jgi:cell wall-associated NlpC family hydrolase
MPPISRFNHASYAATLLVGLSFAGCAGSPAPRQLPERAPDSPPQTGQAEPAPPRRPYPPSTGTGDTGPQSTAQVISKARSLLGRPYRYGGSSPSGFDCSGFTSYVLDSFGVRLPRTAAEQAASGTWIAADEIRSGDLVFFGTDRKTVFHVGLVVSDPGDGLTMIHASTSRGVIETEILSDSYWLPRLLFGRRPLSRQ